MLLDLTSMSNQRGGGSGRALVGGTVDVDAGAVDAEHQFGPAAVLYHEVAHAVALDVLLGVRQVQQLYLFPTVAEATVAGS